MIYILDSLSYREKVLFINTLKKIKEFPAVYINYLNPIRDLLTNSTRSNMGAIVLGEDDFLSFSENLNDCSHDSKIFKEKVPSIVNTMNKEFDRIFFAKLFNYQKNEVVVDGLVKDKNLLNKIDDVSTSDSYPIFIKSVKHESYLEPNKDSKTFFIDIEKDNMESFEEKLTEFLNSLKEKEVVIEMKNIEIQEAA